MNEVILDSSFVVAELDRKDHFHEKAVLIRKKMQGEGLRPVLLDAVMNEVLTVIGKRAERSSIKEGFGKERFGEIFKTLSDLTNPETIFFCYPTIRKYWQEILQWIWNSGGRLSFHDGLILVVMKRFGFRRIATFDDDFREIEGVELI